MKLHLEKTVFEELIILTANEFYFYRGYYGANSAGKF